MLRAGRRVLLALLLVASPGYASDTGKPSDREVKAALAFNFLKFVEWPPDAPVRQSSVIEICVVQDPAFALALGAIGDKTVGGKRLVIREVKAIGQAEGCHVAFLGQSQRIHLPQLSLDLAARGVLTIGDTPGFAESGLVINFFIEDDRVRFEVNLAAARRTRLKLSSKLLRLARLVPVLEAAP